MPPARFRRASLPGLLRVLLEKGSLFRNPVILLLFLTGICSLAITVQWYRSEARGEAVLMHFDWDGHQLAPNGPALELVPNSHKYFHEAGPHEPGDDEQLGHYDVRFFKGKLGEERKRDVQVHMIRAYLDTFRRLGLETWIAHGTLLGWWWNQSLLPWDWDVDTQLSEATLFRMARGFNNTVHTYTTTIAKGRRPTTTSYLLDINPYCKERENGDGMNIIDARWISIDNGLYVDITGLSSLEPDEKPGVVSCKNKHNYTLTNLYPLRETRYEGVAANVPAEYENVLVEEYGRNSLILEEYGDHKWDPSTNRWRKFSNSSKSFSSSRKEA